VHGKLDGDGVAHLGEKLNRKAIARKERFLVVRAGMDDGQRPLGVAVKLGQVDPSGKERMLVGLVANGEQLREIHHPGGVRIAE